MRCRAEWASWSVRSLCSIGAAFVLLLWASSLVLAAANGRVALILVAEDYKSFEKSTIGAERGNRLAEALKARGFDVILAQNASNGGARAALAEFSGKVNGADLGIVVMMGHGIAWEGQTFFLPVNAEISRAPDLMSRGLSVANIAQITAGAKTGAVFFFITLPNFATPLSGLDPRPQFTHDAPPNVVTVFSSSARIPTSRIDPLSEQAADALLAVMRQDHAALADAIKAASNGELGKTVGSVESVSLDAPAVAETQTTEAPAAQPQGEDRSGIEAKLEAERLARETAEKRLAEEEAKAQRAQAAAAQAEAEARKAQADAEKARADAEKAKAEAAQMQAQAQLAKSKAESARVESQSQADAKKAEADAERARADADRAKAEAAQIQAQAQLARAKADAAQAEAQARAQAQAQAQRQPQLQASEQGQSPPRTQVATTRTDLMPGDLSGAPAPTSGSRAIVPAKGLEPEMVALPGGTFLMGSLLDSSEKPVHQVTVQPFAIGRVPVTVGQWKLCVAAGACSAMQQGADDEPARNLSWQDARDYVGWLSKTTGVPYRLPSEAEWEYAARGGTDTRYWWGNEIGTGKANCKGCGPAYDAKGPTKVGQYAANKFGVQDVAGGVEEWVADCWTKDYRSAPRDGSAWDTPNCRERVLRGGSWMSAPQYVRAASRNSYDPTVRYPTHGLRVARSLSKGEKP